MLPGEGSIIHTYAGVWPLRYIGKMRESDGVEVVVQVTRPANNLISNLATSSTSRYNERQPPRPICPPFLMNSLQPSFPS